MVDLACNSGAGDGNYARDVDVNFDGQISIADLEAMDNQFEAHYTSNPLDGPGSNVFIFTGNNGTIDLFEGDGEYSGIGQSDDAFIDQNILENATGSDYLDGTALLQTALVVLSMIATFNDNIEIGEMLDPYIPDLYKYTYTKAKAVPWAFLLA